MSLSAKANAIAAELNNEIDQALSEIADAIVTEQKKRAPKDTGRLANSIHKVRRGPMQYQIVAGGAATTKGRYDYAVGQEFGNHHSPAHPFFYSGYRARKRDAKLKVQAAIDHTIRGSGSS